MRKLLTKTSPVSTEKKICPANDSDQPVTTLDRHLMEIDRQISKVTNDLQIIKDRDVRVIKMSTISPADRLLGQQNNRSGDENSRTRASCRPPMTLPPFTPAESDHIYESIPDITESDEPIYCLPYQPGRTGPRIYPKNGVVNSNFINSDSKRQQLVQCEDINCVKNCVECTHLDAKEDPRGTRSSNSSGGSSNGSRKGGSKKKDGTVSSELHGNFEHTCLKEKSQKEENRDSSSAYNTGDSTGSNHQVGEGERANFISTKIKKQCGILSNL